MTFKGPTSEFEAAIDCAAITDVIAPERETGRDTADLITQSELHKQCKRTNDQTDELEIQKHEHLVNLNMISY